MWAIALAASVAGCSHPRRPVEDAGGGAQPSPIVASATEAPATGHEASDGANMGDLALWSVRPPPNAASHPPSHDYGRLDGATCERQLQHRGIAYRKVEAAGVERAIRLQGRLHGVDFHTEPVKQRATSPYEILDCRLALALDDFAGILARYGIVEVVHMSMYRPPPKSAPAKRGKHSQHEAAMAIDVGAFIRADGAKLVVEKDWHGALGSPTCGEDVRPFVVSDASMALRGILCSAADAHMFQLLLTPNYNKPHFNHFHLEVVRNATWFICK